MSVPRYPKYEDSGVEWIREVAAHWAVNRFKHYVERNDGGAWGQDPDGESDTIVLRSTEQTVDGHWKLDDPAPRKLTQAEVEATLLAEGDLLVTKSSGSSLHIGKTTLVSADVAAMRCGFSNFMQRLRTSSMVDPRLAWYVLNNDLARLQFDLLSNSTTGLANLNATMIGQILLPVAPLPEQASIVAFLDRETAKIDHLVAEQERLIELLKEKRQAVISHAVTKGLNPGVPMKESGIEWLGQVPAHWEVKKLKQVSPQLTVGIVVEPSKFYSREGVPALRSLNVRPGAISLDSMVFITEAGHEQHSKSRLNAGDLVAVRSGQPGTAAVVPPELDGCNCIDLIIVRKPLTGSVHFLCWYLASDAALIQFTMGSGGAIQQHFNISTAAELTVPVPPPSEQLEIVGFVDVQTSKLDTLTAEAQRAIDLLQERRTALISAAVTGQIDVREAAGRAA